MAKAALVSTDFVSATEIGENGHYTYGYIGEHGDEVPTEGMTVGSWFLELRNPTQRKTKRII